MSILIGLGVIIVALFVGWLFLPVLVAAAIWYLLRLFLGVVMKDTGFMDSLTGLAIFILILWGILIL